MRKEKLNERCEKIKEETDNRNLGIRERLKSKGWEKVVGMRKDTERPQRT